MAVWDSLRFIVSHPINRRRLSRGLLDWAAWQMRCRLRAGPHRQPWVQGTRFWARRGETGMTGNIYTGLHEFEDMAFALHVLRPDSLFVDVGANAGSYAILAGGVAGCEVVALEPIGATYARLLDNIELNQLGSRVSALNVAAGSHSGELEFTSGEDTTNHAVGAGEAALETVRVPVRTLDELLAGKRAPELIKIDVEGFEYAVLQGARGLLTNSGANSLLLELNGSGDRYGWRDADVARLLFERGYRSCRYDPFSRRLTDLAGQVNRTGNTLFVRDVERASSRVRSAASVIVKGLQI